MTQKFSNRKPDRCLNCRNQLKESDNYCPECGQRALPERISFSYFVHEFFNNYFSFDSKFIHTIRPLLFKPAFLSLEFINGRRVRYLNPVQLFIFLSFLYFLADSMYFLKDAAKDTSYVTLTEKESRNQQDSLDNRLPKQEIPLIHEEHDDGEIADSLIDKDDFWLDNFLQRSQEFNELEKDEQNEQVNKLISYFIFLLTPLFALLLGVLFPKGHRRFLENLIFSLHFHAFYFLVGFILVITDRLIPENVGDIIMIAIVVIYVFVGVRKFYGYSFLASVLRLLGLFMLYLLAVFVCFVASVIISIML